MIDYKSKIISVEKALSMVKNNDVIVSGMMAMEPQLFLTKLHTIGHDKQNITITNCLPMSDQEIFTNEAYAKRFNIHSWFYSSALRKSAKNGNISFIPNHLHLAGKHRLDHVKTNIYVGVTTPPDKHGFVSLSLSNVYEKKIIEQAELVILEINPNAPRTFGDLQVHLNDIDYLIEADYPIPELPDAALDEKDIKIGQNIASYINDRDCIQLGIGGIPNAVAQALINKKDLGVHTEMLTTGFMKLYKAGAISNKYKNTHRGKMVCCFALGNKELYEFLDNNPAIEILDGNYVNDPYVISRNDNQVSINSTIEVDLTGQCCSESIGSIQFSGAGGQADTAIGAQMSKNGRSFIALYSTAMVKNPRTGEREEVSKIVAQLKPGAVVTLQRQNVQYVVTEYGIVNLRGTTVEERVKLLISIAHPKFRDQILKDAHACGLINERKL
jgi:acyl-CoA hydrolase